MITVNSLSQNKSELNISGVGLNKQYISVLIDGIISKIISISYRKIVVAIPQNARIKTVSVHLHINENDSIYYVNAGQIHLGEFRNGMPVAVFEDLIDVNNNDNPSVLLDSSSSTSSIMDSSKSSEFSVSSSSPLDSLSSSSSSDSLSSSSSSDSLSSSSSSSDSDSLSSSSSSDSSSDSTTLLPYTVYRILGGTHWDDTVSYNGSAVVPLDNNPF